MGLQIAVVSHLYVRFNKLCCSRENLQPNLQRARQTRLACHCCCRWMYTPALTGELLHGPGACAAPGPSLLRLALWVGCRMIDPNGEKAPYKHGGAKDNARHTWKTLLAHPRATPCATFLETKRRGPPSGQTRGCRSLRHHRRQTPHPPRSSPRASSGMFLLRSHCLIPEHAPRACHQTMAGQPCTTPHSMGVPP